MPYHHTQKGHLFALYGAGFGLLTLIIVLTAGRERVQALLTMAVSFVVVMAVAWWFNRLTVSITGDEVRVFFGPGRPHRSFSPNEIDGFRIVRNKWYYGIGARWAPGGSWLYSVWGLDAVELDLTSGKKFRIGTDEPDQVMAALAAHPIIGKTAVN